VDALPLTLVGTATLQQSSSRLAVGIEIQHSGEPIAQSDQSVSFSVVYQLFVSSPTVGLAGVGTMVVERVTRQVTLIPDQYGCLSATGEFSSDYQRLEGLATFRDFQLMDVMGTFENCPFVLTAYDDD
jgi:hypothetical protein